VKIYTKTGDRGDTGLLGGSRISKRSARICAIGDVDELNAGLGVARATGGNAAICDELERIQSWLFDVGAELAAPPAGRIQYAGLTEGASRRLEESIDAQTAELPPLNCFILPGGTPLAAQLHVCRSVCRRAERSVVNLAAEEAVRDEITVFLNRLSDWLFVTARTANRTLGVSDLEWKKQEA
jgi:cob(I)alamin adenosyltransferase